mmetsp:Transcript_64941/g.146496  ORF Transcript_64941/g.146496 Transcript_64941/m.146496 type:complete len:460 (-) Transcript_64941:104-1483(-)
MLSFMHFTWNPNKHSNRMMIVDVSSFDIGDIGRWSASLANARVSMTPPHIKIFQVTFSSVLWKILMQVFVPIAALYTCGVATLEIVRLCKILGPGRHLTRISPTAFSTKLVSLIIVVIEAPCMLLIGVLMACGQFGNMMLPFHIHFAGYLLFTGMSVVTTILVAILMREEWRASKGFRRRNVIDHWKFIIVLVLMVFGGWDLYNISSILAGQRISQTALFSSMIVVAVVQGGAAIQFFAQAIALRLALQEIAALPVTVQHPKNEKKLHRVIDGLAVAGGACINATISTVFTMLGVGGYLRSETSGLRYTITFFVFAFGRVFVSYTQIQVMKPSTIPFHVLLGSYVWQKGSACSACFFPKPQVHRYRVQPSDVKRVRFADDNEAVLFHKDRPTISILCGENISGGSSCDDGSDENLITCIEIQRSNLSDSNANAIRQVLKMAPPEESRKKKIYMKNDIFE